MADRTKTMTAIFTPGYAAPEQFTSAKQGPWTDIYGLAATLYYAITGKAPPSAFDRLMEDTYEPLASRQPPGFAPGLLAWHRCRRCRFMPSGGRRASPAGAPCCEASRPTAKRRGDGAFTDIDAAGAIRRADGARRLAACIRQVAGAGSRRRPADDGKRLRCLRAQAVAANRVDGDGIGTAGAGSGGGRAEALDGRSPAHPARPAFAGLRHARHRRYVRSAFAEMIAAWQRSRQHPATGYLTAAESQALLREAKPAEAASRPAPAAVPSGAAAGSYIGSLSGSATGGGSPSLPTVEAQLNLAGRQLTGRLIHPTCGSLPVSLAVDPAGAISGNLRLYEAGGCATNPASAGGRLAGGSLSLDLRGIDVSYRGSLSSPTQRSPGGPAPPSGLRTDVP